MLQHEKCPLNLNFHDVVICGTEALLRRGELSAFYFPSKLFFGSTSMSKLPILKDRFKPGKTMIYVCTNSECKKPVETADEAINLLQEN